MDHKLKHHLGLSKGATVKEYTEPSILQLIKGAKTTEDLMALRDRLKTIDQTKVSRQTRVQWFRAIQYNIQTFYFVEICPLDLHEEITRMVCSNMNVNTKGRAMAAAEADAKAERANLSSDFGDPQASTDAVAQTPPKRIKYKRGVSRPRKLKLLFRPISWKTLIRGLQSVEGLTEAKVVLGRSTVPQPIKDRLLALMDRKLVEITANPPKAEEPLKATIPVSYEPSTDGNSNSSTRPAAES